MTPQRRTLTTAAALTAATLVLGLAGCATDNAAEEGTTTLRVATLVGLSSLPIQVGIEEGFFEEHGIKVELTGGNDVAAWQTAVGEQFDLVLTNPATYTMAASRGLDNMLINSMVTATSDFPLSVFAAEQPIEDLEQLRGMKVGIPSLTGLAAQTLQYVLDEAGVASSEYELVTMPFNVHGDNLRAGNVDVVITAQPYMVVLEQEGFWVSDRDISIAAVNSVTGGDLDSFTNVSFVADAAWAGENDDVLDRWLAGLEDSIEYIEAHPDAARAILQEWVGYDDALADAVVLPGYSLPVEEAQFSAMWDVLVAIDAVSGAFPSERFHLRSHE